MKKLITLMILLVVVLVACTVDSGTEDSTLVIYSNRNERFVQNLIDNFSEEHGVNVQVLHGASPLQIIEESNNTRADIYISNDLGALSYLDTHGYLSEASLAGIESIPENFRADNNSYFAISLRARGFIYNKDLISAEEMPKSVEDLFSDDLTNVPNGYAITRGGNSGMIGHISALRYEWGDEKTSQWISAIVQNASGIYEGHGDIRRAVGAGEHSFGLVNNYYFHQQLLEPNDNNVGFIYLDQQDNQMGTVANAAGVGLVNNGPNSENAILFLEWLLEPENQVQFVGDSLELLINSEYGAIYPAEVSPHIIDFSDLKIQDMSIKELGNYFEDTTKLIEDSGLALNLR